MTSLRLADPVRIELLPRAHGPALAVAVAVAGVPVDLDENELAALVALAAGRSPPAVVIESLVVRGLVRRDPTPPFATGTVALARSVLLEARFAAARSRLGTVRPDNALALGLFVPPSLLGELQAMAAALREAWQKMVSAALSRGRVPDPESLARELAAIARELHAQSAELATATTVRDTFRLEARRPCSPTT